MLGRDPKPGDELRRAIDVAIHRKVNDKLYELRRGGFATVHRDIYMPHLDALIDQGEFAAEEIVSIIDRAVAEAVQEYVHAVARFAGWMLHDLEAANDRIDSLALQRFIESQRDAAITGERDYLVALLAPDTDPEEVNE